VSLTNVTFSSNTIAYANASATASYGGGLYRYSGTVNVSNSIFWNNRRGNGIADQLNTGIIVSSSLVQNGYKAGSIILTEDPQFQDIANDNLALSSCSPAVNMGDNSKAAGISVDLEGNPRITHSTIDLGAYEYQGILLDNAEQTLPEASQWKEYNHKIAVGTGEYTYALVYGLLPDGMLLAADGTLSGSPS